MRCLRGAEHVFGVYAPDGKRLAWRSTFESFWIRGSGPAGTRFRQIPLHIIPLGLSLDSLVYAAPLAGIILLPRWMRRLRRASRRRRGHCPACNYDLRGLARNSPCPECGKPT